MSEHSNRKSEISFEVEAHECSVLDGYCQATGKTRTRVVRELLKEWSSLKHMESIMIVRVAGSNPDEPGSLRERSGNESQT